MKKIVYIMGAGRSGTTLLDILLGNNPGIFSGGELNRFPKKNGVPPGATDEDPKSLFWNEFKSKLPGQWQQKPFSDIQRLCSSFEYHTAITRVLFPWFNNSFKHYRSLVVSFFDTLAPMVPAPVLIDSSKYPLRGYHLARMLDYEMTYVYVKRNPLDVVQSFAKKDVEQPRKGWLMTNLYLLWVNLLCLYVLKKINGRHHAVTVSYDELVAEPEKTLNNIGKKLLIDVSHSVDLIQQKKSFKPGMLFDGNRIRLQKEIFLKGGKSETKPEGIKDKITLLIQQSWWKQENKN